MRFALETRPGPGPASEFATMLTGLIEGKGGEVVTVDTTPDMVISVGGDGTMLGAIRQALTWDVPVLGFNLGALGFLAQAEPEDVDLVMNRILAGDHGIEERMTITASIGGKSVTGVNDVVVEKVESTRLVNLEVTVDGEPFVVYRADGLILATPTGSTAYSFSAGGPLIDPKMEAIVMTPVASHSLFDRALVLPASTVIDVKVLRDRKVKANVDKTVLGELTEGQHVEIRRGSSTARFVTLDGTPFTNMVKGKFQLD
jgi:NAD+ kinase